MVHRDDHTRLHLQFRGSRFLVALLLLLASARAAAWPVISGCGFGWGPGPLQASGETLDLVGVVTFIDAELGADLAANEYTLQIAGLISTGPVNFGRGFYGISFTGGTFEIWRDPGRNASYGMNPPNATVPATFVDNVPYLTGWVSSCFLFYDTNFGVGSWESFLHFDGGEAEPLLEGFQADAWSMGGAFDAPSGNTPPGYWLASSFGLEPGYFHPSTAADNPDCSQTVSVSAETWTAIKRIYRE